jgi:hypothetical protein
VLGLDLVVVQEGELGTGSVAFSPAKSAWTVSISSALRSSPVLARM